MKYLLLIAGIFLILSGCTEDEDYFVVNGRLEKAINGEGVPNEIIKLRVEQHWGSGLISGKREIDYKEVTTDSNGNFSALMKNDSNIYIFAHKRQTDLSSGFDGTFDPYDSIIIKTNNFVKFEVTVKNTTPFDSNDYIKVGFYTSPSQNFRTEIENFGVENIHHPEDGSGVAAWDESSWIGKNVNSILYYNVPENSSICKIIWTKRKNGVETEGISENIPFEADQINEYSFEY